MNDALHSASEYAAERYILGELPAEEREKFEEHYFSCPECADRVMALAAFVENAKLVLPEMDRIPVTAAQPDKPKKSWLSWLSWSFAPEAALATIVLLLGITVYQNTVEIPHLVASAASDDFTLSTGTKLTARRGRSEYTFSAKSPITSLTVDNEWEEKFPSYVSEIHRESESGPLLKSYSLDGSSGELVVTLRPTRLGSGKYTMILYGIRADGSRKAVANQPFTLQE